MANYALGLTSPAASGSGAVAHFLDTVNAFSAGKLLSLRNNSAEVLSVDYAGVLTATGSPSFGGDAVAATRTLSINTAAGRNRQISFQSGGVGRWIFQVAGTESGDNTGADLALLARADDGSSLRTVLDFDRASGAMAFGSTIASNVAYRFAGIFTSGSSSTTAMGFSCAVTLTAAEGDTNYLAQFRAAGTITTQGASETISVVACIHAVEPSITVGAGDTITTAATVYIASAPTEGVSNYALYAAAGSCRFASAGPHAFGTTISGASRFIIDGDYTSTGSASSVRGLTNTGQVTAATGDTTGAFGFYCGCTVVTQGASETLNVVAQAVFYEPTITVSAGDTVTLAATVYIVSAPTEGTTNAALYVASGDVLLAPGVLTLAETTTPTAKTDWGKVYTKNDNKLYFQDGAGTEHEIAYA